MYLWLYSSEEIEAHKNDISNYRIYCKKEDRLYGFDSKYTYQITCSDQDPFIANLRKVIPVK